MSLLLGRPLLGISAAFSYASFMDRMLDHFCSPLPSFFYLFVDDSS
jgi:hypothetical protein